MSTAFNYYITVVIVTVQKPLRKYPFALENSARAYYNESITFFGGKSNDPFGIFVSSDRYVVAPVPKL